MPRTDYWTMAIDELAKIAGDSGFSDSPDEATSKGASRVLNARAVLEASETSKRLVWATWALVVVTTVVAIATAFGG